MPKNGTFQSFLRFAAIADYCKSIMYESKTDPANNAYKS